MDTPSKKKSMRSFKNSKLSKVKESEVDTKLNDFDGFEYNEETVKKIKEYNANVTNLDSDYTSFTPRTGIIVRVFLHEPKVEGNIVIPYTQSIIIPTQNGLANVGETESPYPYSKKAVIVSVPEVIKDLKVGDIVQIENEVTKGYPIGGGRSAAIAIPKAFTLHTYDKPSNTPPTDPNHKHYGYLKIDSRDIAGIL